MKAAARRAVKSPAPTRLARPVRHRLSHGEALERQAHQSAAAFIRGDQGLAHHLTPAPAGNFHLPSSPGVPLSSNLRAELESGFGADLGAVRIHADANASAAACDAGAMAFASGAHVYFQSGRFGSDTVSGRSLIAHEVAHVLQQTARVTSGNQLRAVDLSGTGTIQCWSSPLESTRSIPTVAVVLEAHRGAKDLANDERGKIEALQRGLASAGATGRDAFQQERAKHYDAQTFDPVLSETPSKLTAPVASALYDFFKSSMLPGPAARMLNERRDLRTRFFSANVYQTYMDDFAAKDFSVAEERFYHHWYTSAWFGKATPRAILDRTLVQLMGATAGFSDQLVSNRAALGTEFATELKRIDSGEMLPDELYFATVHTAGQLEQMRANLLNSVMQSVRSLREVNANNKAESKGVFVLLLKGQLDAAAKRRDGDLAKAVIASPGEPSRETLLIWHDDLLPALQDMTDYALEFWKSSATFEAGLGPPASKNPGKAVTGAADAAHKQLARLEVEIPGYREMLERFLHSMLDREPDGRVPEPGAFVSRRDAAVKRLDTDSFRVLERPLADRLIDTLPDARTEAPFSFNRALADKRLPGPTASLFAWAQRLVSEFRALVSTYTRADDDILVTRQRSVDARAPAADLRHILRMSLARAMAELGHRAHWPAWVDWALTITEGRETLAGAASTDDYIAFGSDWKLDDTADVGGMIRDLPAHVSGFTPLTTRDLVEFYQAANFRDTSKHIDTLLSQRGKRFERKDQPILQEAVAETRKQLRPQRFVVKHWEWAHKDGAQRQDLLPLIMEHPLTQARITDEARRSPILLRAVNAPMLGGRMTLVLWTAPSPEVLIERLQAVPDINAALVAAAAARPKLDQLTVQQLQALPWDQWWDRWWTVLAGFDGPAREALLKKMHDAKAGLSQALKTERAAAQTQYQLDERRAIAHERRWRIEVILRPTLAAFEPYGHNQFQVPGGKKTYRRLLAGEVALEVERFALPLPNEEREGQRSMALLELSDTLNAKLGSLPEPREFYVWSRLIDDALVWAQDPKKGADTAHRDTFTAEAERGDAALFEKRRDTLTTLLMHMSKVFQEHFEQWGIVATKGDGTIENSGSAHGVGDEGRDLGRGTVFANEGRTFEIIEVRESFVFHPGAINFRSLPQSATGGTRLKLGKGEFLAEGKRPHTLLMYVIRDGGPDVTPIYADDDPALLTQITWALHMYATLQQLNELGAAIQTFGEIMMDAAELFPGGGQALAAARIVTTAMGFIHSDLPSIAVHLITHPRELLEKVWDKLTDLFSLGNLLDLLLLGNFSLNGLIREQPADLPKNPGGSSSRRIRRLMHKLRSLALGVGRVVARTEDAVQDRRVQVEQFIQGHPGIVRFVQIVADYYLVIASIVDHLAQITDLDEALAAFTNPAEFATHINETIAAIGHVELPEEILPLHELIDALIDIVGNRLGGKYRLGVQILFKLLDVIGAREEIVSGLVGVLRNAGLTTDNVFPFWKDPILEKVGGYLEKGQSAIRDSLDDAFKALGLPLNLAQPKSDVRTFGSEFPKAAADLPAGTPEGQPMLDQELREGFSRQAGSGGIGGDRAAHLLRTIPTEPGEPLAPRARALAEQRFGQDFSHVRLHRSGHAAGIARDVGARAVTSGSHIVMGRDTDSRTLYHELAHVVQQTGPRAPGKGRNARPPRAGRPGRGLHWNETAESRADQAAAAALRGNARDVALSGTSNGWQPSMLEMLGQRFLRQVTDITGIEHEVEDIDKTAGGTGIRLIGKDVRQSVAHVAENLKSIFRPGAKGLFAPASGPFHGEVDAISSHLLGNHSDIAAAIEDIAIRASNEAGPGKKKDGPPQMQLDVDDFTRRLERYIFGKTGIQLDLEGATTGRGRKKTFTNPHAPFTKATVTFVFLAPIHGNSQLWRDALQTRSMAGGVAPKAITAAEQAELRAQIRAILRDLGPSASIWMAKEYRLSAKIFAAADELTKLQQTGALTGTLPHNALPTAEAYCATDKFDKSNFGNLRLHLGTYQQKTSGEQKGKERESHHITQYLLAEYFHNGSGSTREKETERMGFPLLGKFPSEKPYGERLKESQGVPQSFDDMKIAALEAGRGGGMPTILLARGTHRRGNLHITPMADDFDDSAATQAGAANHMYKSGLPDKQRTLEREVARGIRPYSEWKAFSRNGNFADAIAEAMQGTYKDIRRHMQNQLKSGLLGIERDYFNELYLAGNPGSKAKPLTSSAVLTVWGAAKKHNDTIMNNNFGWTA